MKVLKFGGTSVANASNIEKVLTIIASYSEDIVVVVSAFSGVTDTLLRIGRLAAKGDESYKELLIELEQKHLTAVKELIPVQKQSHALSHIKSELNKLETLFEGTFLLSELSTKTEAIISGYGELLSSYIIGESARSRGLDVLNKDTRELIQTTVLFGKKVVDFDVTNSNCSSFFKQSKAKITLLPGFVASDENGVPTTLGRGGSDYTAAIIAGALKVEALEIWTDVSGMYTANPNLVRQAVPIKNISYQEAMELSHFGAKVLYAPTIHPALQQNIPIWIKNTFKPNVSGTCIANESDEGQAVKGISHIENIALLTLQGSGMVGFPGYSKRLLEALSNEGINIIMITQASSEQSICIGIDSAESDKAKALIDQIFEYEISIKRINPVSLEKELAIIALVGDKMKSHQGISGKMFSALGNNNINVKAIAQGASEKNITAVINKKDVKKALNTLHERFFEANIKQLNLFITGLGNVGSKLIDQIQSQTDYLKDQLRLSIRVAGISNSRKMVFDEKGIDLTNWGNLLDKGNKSDTSAFLDAVKSMNIRNSIFVDNTASEKIAQVYEHYLENNIGVVTCNKIACADQLSHYKKLKELSRNFGVPFLFETNVGAGLPIIDTLNNLIASGDKVHTIQAVLSGSLNFIFNNFDNENSFHDVVLEAQKQGFTEPDPKIDLSGVDVARKILILARESGNDIELEDIENKSFMPKECLETADNDAFFKSLIAHKEHFNSIYDKASKEGARIKYVAQFKDGKASVGLQHIPKGHDFYNLEGSDNIVLFYTDRYVNQPLIVKGAGAGAEVTASGIFADIIRIGKR
jgi:aspartokinase/homoserine dehydrogenase 1